jgi:hypothetical protein
MEKLNIRWVFIITFTLFYIYIKLNSVPRNAKETNVNRQSVIISNGNNFRNYWGKGNLFPGAIPNCNVDCHWIENARNATALWFYRPGINEWKEKEFPQQKFIFSSLEPKPIYPNLNCGNVRLRYDIYNTFQRSSSHVPAIFAVFDIEKHRKDKIKPFSEKLDRIVFLNRNCNTETGREDWARYFMKKGLHVDSMSSCLNNKKIPKTGNKITWFSDYKFCLVMENSLDDEYISEKPWYT